jgi:hypothetical protein
MLSVVMLSVIMLSVVMLSVVMLNDVAQLIFASKTATVSLVSSAFIANKLSRKLPRYKRSSLFSPAVSCATLDASILEQDWGSNPGYLFCFSRFTAELKWLFVDSKI